MRISGQQLRLRAQIKDNIVRSQDSLTCPLSLFLCQNFHRNMFKNSRVTRDRIVLEKQG